MKFDELYNRRLYIDCMDKCFWLSALLFVFFIKNLPAQNMETHDSLFSFKKLRIKTMTDYLYFLDKKEIDSFKVQKKYFDRNGKDTLVEYFSITNQKVFSKNIKKYDKQGRLIKKIDLRTSFSVQKINPGDRRKSKNIKVIDDHFNVELITINKYDKKGKLIAKKEFDAEGNLLKWYNLFYKYNNAGNTTELKIVCSDTDECKRDVYLYDEKGNKTGQYSYNSSDSLLYYIISEYDSLGNQIWMYNFTKNNKLKEKFLFRYDDKGNRVERVFYNADSVIICKNISIFDSKGHPVELIRIPYTNELEYLRTVTNYNKNGIIISNIRYDKDNKPFRMQKFIYTFYRK